MNIKEPIEFHFSEFDEYIRQGEPDQREKASIWSMAIGLQQVDLRSLGWNVDNDMFAKYAWYFRNALVRANYRNIKLDIEYSPIYLERFFRNLLLGENWDLKSRYLHILPPEEWQEQPILPTHSE